MNKFDIGDAVSFIITDDSSVLCFVNPDDTIVVSLVTSKIPQNASWKDSIQRKLNELLGESVSITNSIFKMVKSWVPSAQMDDAYIINVIVMAKVPVEFKNYFVIPATGKFAKLKWLNERDLHRFYNLRVVSTPLFLELFPKIKSDLLGNCQIYPTGTYEGSNFIELTSTIMYKELGNPEINKVIDNYIPKSALKSVYLEFLKIIFPEVNMSCGHFSKIVTKLGFNRQESQFIFSSADLFCRHFLSFREFLGIAAALEPNAKHIGGVARARTLYIFRYLNRNCDGKLSLKDLKELVILLRKSRQLSTDAASIEKELKDTAVALNITPTHTINCDEFIKAADDMRIRGLGDIFRSNKSLLSLLTVPVKSLAIPAKTGFNFIPSSVERAVKDTVHWEIATHSTKITNSGTAISLEPIFNTNICSAAELDSAKITKLSRRLSLDKFAPKFVCNELLDNIRELATVNGIHSGNRGNKNRDYIWGNVIPTNFAQKLIVAAQMAKDVLDKEPRLLSITSPVYILGDFHGNFGDLLYFEKMFWPLNPVYNPSTILLLGDYVDRGWYSMEVSTYLICNKVLYPKRIFLVRGNHEIREVQAVYTFLTECIAKFGETLGKSIWDTINTVFDYMPLAAVIDEKIFCCHGGIPPPWLAPTAAAINLIPKPLPDPDNKSPLAWDLLWNDPVKDKDITKEMMIEMLSNDGFALNPKRGTAHVFNNAATLKFLKTNQFSHIVRAHELAMSGFNVFHKGKVITIFSSSKYNGCNNESACILVDNFKLQVFRLDPSNLTY